VPLKHLAEYQNGFAFKPEHRGAQGRPIIRIAQLTSSEPAAYYDGPIDPRVVVHPGDLLFSWSATLDSYLWDGPEALLNQHIFRVTPIPSVEKRYLYYVLKSVVGLLGDHHAHGSTMTHIKREDLSHKVPVPPLDEQRRIAAFLDFETARIEGLLREQECLSRHLADKRTALVRDALTVGFLTRHRPVPTSSRWFPTVPEGWSVTTLKRVLTANDGGVWGDDPVDEEAGTVVLRSTDQTVDGEWRISEPAVRALSPSERVKATLREGDLLVTKSSGSEAHIGKTTLVTGEVAAMRPCYSNFMQRLRLNSRLLPRVIWYVMNSEAGRQQLSYASNTTTGLANLNGELLGELHVPIAPASEQRVLLDHLDEETARIRRLVGEVGTSSALLRERRSALITAAVTGQIDVRSWRPPNDWATPEAA